MRVLQFAGSSVLVIFGSLTCALVDASADTHPHLRHRNQQECRQVSVLAVFCPPPYLDGGVVCNGNCEYGNLCLAATAGILESFCEKPDSDPEACPENVLLPCSGSFDKPVICNNGCQYDNICLAVGAGGRGCEDFSEEVRPIPDSELQPPLVNLDPLKCPPAPVSGLAVFCPPPYSDGGVICNGNCEYGNLCLATTLDIDGAVAFTADECKSLTNPLEPECLESDPGLVCPFNYEPVDCNGCVYSNECFASGAGYDLEDCVNETTGCNESDPSFVSVCGVSLPPVVCIRDGDACEYGNQCLADGAGFSETDCLPAIF
jgi:hypothetical protein